jgi:hypothetical protein
LSSAFAQSTNLPDVAPGVFNVSAQLELQTTTSAVWDALTDFPAYASWNPFVRCGWQSAQLQQYLIR